MDVLIARDGRACKQVEGVNGIMVVVAGKYTTNGLLVVSRYALQPDRPPRHVNTYVTTREALVALYGVDGWTSAAQAEALPLPVAA